MAILSDQHHFAFPEKSDRFFQIKTDAEPLLGTPGLQAAFGDNVRAGLANFTQAAPRGFFLQARKLRQDDPAVLGAAIGRVPRRGSKARLCGTRREKALRTATGTHVHMEQLIRGARVVGADLRVHQAEDNSVFAMTGRPLGDLESRDPGPPPPENAREARVACAERFGVEEMPRAKVELVVFPETKGSAWAYEVTFTVREEAADVIAFLRADDLSLMLSTNIAVAAKPRARVFKVNPLQTPKPVLVDLKGLDKPGRRLRNAIVDVRPATGDRITRDDGDFRLKPTDPGFDEVQAYHHLSRTIEYFRGLVRPELLAGHPFRPMPVYVNDPSHEGNAYFFPNEGEVRFGRFGSRPSSRSLSMVAHEFAHAITDATCKLARAWPAVAESRGLAEGFSDYFAASMLDDPRFADYVTEQRDGARNCAATLRFPADFIGGRYVTGAAWASVLWGLRGEIGQADCDRLAMDSISYLSPASTFDEAVVALHTVDDRLFAGKHREAIDEQYAARAPL